MKYFEALVVGAGLAGSTAARILAEQGRKVLVICCCYIPNVS